MIPFHINKHHKKDDLLKNIRVSYVCKEFNFLFSLIKSVTQLSLWVEFILFIYISIFQTIYDRMLSQKGCSTQAATVNVSSLRSH